MKRLSYTAAVLLVLICTTMLVLSQERDSASQEPATTLGTIRSIEGTAWAGTDSDGDFYEFTFLKGGQLRYRTNTSRKEIVTLEDKDNVWAQNGQIVIIVIKNYSTYNGTLREDRIEGKAWNVQGKRWAWEVKKRHR